MILLHVYRCSQRSGFAILLALAFAVPVWSQTDKEQAIESGRKSLQKAARFPWYEPDTDEVSDVELPASKQPEQSIDWQKKTQPRRNWNMPSFWRFVQYATWIGLAILLALFILWLPKWLRGSKRRDFILDDDLSDEERIQQLPFSIKTPLGDLLSQARSLYETGNYRDAIVYLYSYKLVQLDKAHLIRLTKGKTNRQYLRELRAKTDLKGILTGTMLVFEDVFFGRYDLSKERFEECWNQLDRFQALLRQSVATS